MKPKTSTMDAKTEPAKPADKGNPTVATRNPIGSFDDPIKYLYNSFVKYISPELLPGNDGKNFPKCERCNGHKDIARMFRIISVPCWNCRQNMKLAFVEIAEVILILPNQFTAVERELAARRGVYLKKCRDCVEPGGYANFCRFCKKATDYFRITALVGSINLEYNIVSGYDCNQCDSDEDYSDEN